MQVAPTFPTILNSSSEGQYYYSVLYGSDIILSLFAVSSLAMTKPDRQLIAQVMLYSQGFRTAEKLASKIVPFFK